MWGRILLANKKLEKDWKPTVPSEVMFPVFLRTSCLNCWCCQKGMRKGERERERRNIWQNQFPGEKGICLLMLITTLRVGNQGCRNLGQLLTVQLRSRWWTGTGALVLSSLPPFYTPRTNPREWCCSLLGCVSQHNQDDPPPHTHTHRPMRKSDPDSSSLTLLPQVILQCVSPPQLNWPWQWNCGAHL